LTRLASIAAASCVAAAVTAAAADRKGDTAPSEATLDLYRSKCQPCHLADGNSPLEPMNFSDSKWTHGSKPEEVAKVITDGVPTTAMLPFKAQLTPAEIADLAAYVRSFDKSLKATRKTK
jgi:cytochrome c oxidase cbb3-type subunit 3